MTLWIALFLIILLASIFIVYPIFRARTTHNRATLEKLNTDIARQQIKELDADLANNILTKEQYDDARSDLERSLLDNLQQTAAKETIVKGRWLIFSLPILVLIGSFAIYSKMGTPDADQKIAAAQARSQKQAEMAKNLPSVDQMILMLEKKMEEVPDNIEGWKMLGRTYAATGSANKAINAYEKAYTLDPSDVDTIISYADVIASVNGNDFTGKPESLIKEAQSIDAEHPDVLWMTGVVAFQKADYAYSIQQWNTLLAKLPPESEAINELQQALAEAKGRATTASSAKPLVQNQPINADTSTGVKVRVTLSESLRDQVTDQTILFVFAKASNGPPMPLAAYKGIAKELPLDIELTDEMAMMPQLRLSNFTQVTVSARLSISGQPSASSGDLQGIVTPVDTRSGELINVVIDQKID